MKTLTCILASIMLAVSMADAETIEDRVGSLEKKLDLILRLLQKETGGAVANPAPGAPSAVPQAQKEKGKAVPSGKGIPEMQPGTILNAYPVTRGTFQTPQAEAPIVVNFPDSTSEFRLGNFLSSPNAKLFENNQVGVKWEGYLNIKEAGVYEFVGNSTDEAYSNDGGRRGNSICLLAVAGQNVATQEGRNAQATTGTISLEAEGMYAVQIWIGPAGKGTNSVIRFEFHYRKQGDPDFKKITPGSLYRLKEK